MISCPNCSKENQGHYKFCLGCGLELPSSAQSSRPSRQTPVPSSSKAPEPGGMPIEPYGVTGHRPRRGVAVHLGDEPILTAAPAAGDHFVRPQVSTSPASAAKMNACPNCDELVPKSFRFCHVCGHDLHGATSTAASVAAVSQSAARSHTQAYDPKAVSRMRGRLVMIQPDGSEGEALQLTSSVTPIGRSTAAVFANDGYLSPHHAEFEFDGERLLVRDTSSLNGVFVRMDAEVPVEITDGDAFRIGQEVLEFQSAEAPDVQADGTHLMGTPIGNIVGRVCIVVGQGQCADCYAIHGSGVHFGRERGEVIFPEDGYVSGLHCRIHSEIGKVFLTDLKSSNGTFLRVRGEEYVASGAMVLMGQQLFRAEFE